MRENRTQATRVLIAVLFAVLATFGLSTASSAVTMTAPVAAAPAQPSCGDTSSYTKVNLSALPKEATDTVNLIKKGGPFPFPKNDGVVFTNREGILPSCDSGYYHEYTVITPGSSDRGTRRIITGEGGEYFYTGDHYKTFSTVDINA